MLPSSAAVRVRSLELCGAGDEAAALRGDGFAQIRITRCGCWLHHVCHADILSAYQLF